MRKNSDSDDDFWDQIEQQPVLQPSKQRFDKSEFFETVTPESLKISIFPSDKTLKLLNNVRLSKEEELRIHSILIRKQTIREVKLNAEEIKKHYEDEVQTIVKENLALKENLISLRKRLFRSSEKCKDQEFLITTLRIKENIKEEPLENKSLAIQEDSKHLHTQIKLAKEVCGIYIDKLDENEMKIQELNQTIEQSKKEYEKKIRVIEDEKSQCEKALEERIKKISDEFEKYKKDVGLEINLQSVIQKKQSATIASLKTEMNKAKIVLASPRLKTKASEKYEVLGGSVDKTLATDRSHRHRSILSLPMICSEKDVFNNTIIPVSNDSSKFLKINTSKKQFRY